MPQINRIRVNNVKYNFGTQVYDDFVMRFNCRNTIYDLANGGGKSLLMLLLMQNMLPNCTLDDKQPIEKLFRQGSGNTCIHSLVEWKLDSCYQNDGFKYMTTGFCARKGKGQEDEADGADNASVTASVEYYNYCIFYREFGDNDIKNLPLVKDGERITFNGLKAYLRELEKGEYKYIVKIFDRKGDYQSFISNYGIYESAWEIVRGINKTEGHVRTYFESNYRTSRKVVEDLLIEEIIQKSFNNRLSVDNDEGQMAKTLLDIKDKLVELSKKHSQMGAYDSQIAAIDSFKEYLSSYESFYSRKKEIEKQLYELLIVAIVKSEEKEKELNSKENEIEKIRHDINKEKEMIAVAEVMSEKRSMEAVEAMVKDTDNAYKLKEKEMEDISYKLSLMEAANDYKDYLDYEKSFKEISVAVENRLRDDSDIITDLKKLSCKYKQLYDVELKSLEEKRTIAENNIKNLSAKLEASKDELRLADKETAGFYSLKDNLSKQISKKEAELKKLMADAGTVVVENAQTDYLVAKEEVNSLQKEKATLLSRIDELRANALSLRENANACKALINILTKEREQLKDKDNVSVANSGRMDKIRSIYESENDQEMLNVILEAYRRMERDKAGLVSEASEIESFIANANEGTYECKDPKRDKLKEYLISQYGDDVVEGHEWFRELSVGQKRDVLKRTPFVEYGFIIKNDFERVKVDETLKNFGRGATAFPVISEQVLYDTKLEINKDLIVFALKDMSFLREDGRLETEIKLAKEELETLNNQIDRLNDRMNLVWEDYTFCLEFLAVFKNADISATIAEIDEQISENEVKVIETEESASKIEKDIKDCELNLASTEERLKSQALLCDSLNGIITLNSEIQMDYDSVKELTDGLNESLKKVSEYEARNEKLKRELEQADSFLDGIQDNLKQLLSSWEIEYAAYYDDSVSIGISDEIYNLEKDDVESRFLGLKSSLGEKNTDVADKEALMNHLKLSMNKCTEAIEYRGFTLDDIKSQVNEGKIVFADTRKLKSIKEEQLEIKNESNKIRSELEAQEALLNRLEGSIAHGINQIEVTYGEYKEFDCENPEAYMEQHKAFQKTLNDSIKDLEKARKILADELKDLLVCRKDLERSVKDADMDVPTKVTASDAENISADLKEYEAVQKEYASINKLEYKKVDEFAKNKQKLIDLLKGFNAVELADEVKVSLNLPDNIEKTKMMINSLSETNTFIQLEKDRVAKGIEDMEMIKDNFENRCIQTCSNIKTELDRLPQLSNINLDGEQISIISLQIPYIKEEQYKEKMSEYIDETVIMAESFKDTDERLKYIRNRLTWKRLFSVIVTDMNSIRINLYKRERIKDQSRYLRYEEAVGSTGQSQGIYIQFLIAIINYISNMNAGNSDGGVEGKTIFIDNPFGAAKDIYIWEPIFKLLQTNHVQLIVPARGATPAITGRFDVNYILGQKLVDKRQQTVVVDYFSSTKESELEYTRMDYEQATFDFI